MPLSTRPNVIEPAPTLLRKATLTDFFALTIHPTLQGKIVGGIAKHAGLPVQVET